MLSLKRALPTKEKTHTYIYIYIYIPACLPTLPEQAMHAHSATEQQNVSSSSYAYQMLCPSDSCPSINRSLLWGAAAITEGTCLLTTCLYRVMHAGTDTERTPVRNRFLDVAGSYHEKPLVLRQRCHGLCLLHDHLYDILPAICVHIHACMRSAPPGNPSCSPRLGNALACEIGQAAIPGALRLQPSRHMLAHALWRLITTWRSWLRTDL